jgi:hypothetical protein
MSAVNKVTAALLPGKALCVSCLSLKTGLRQAKIATVLADIGKSVSLFRAEDACARCRNRRTVYALFG